MSRAHSHRCTTPGCKNTSGPCCHAPQDYDGSPNCCVDEDRWEGWICEDCWGARAERQQLEDEFSAALAQRDAAVTP